MKKLLLTFTFVIFYLFPYAQITVHDSSAFLDINQIKAKIYTGGLNFLDKYDTIHPNYYEFPANSGKHTILSSALWIGGLNSGKLYLAGEQYQFGKRDYYPGPVMDSITFQTEVVNWNKVWKISKAEIAYHLTHWNSPGYIMPQSISSWPVYANALLGINYYLAPFVDADSNGAYNPANGDYPAIRGDQAIYFIFNDSVFRHTETTGRRMGVEIHAMAYAYNSVPELNRTVFMNYMIYNRSNRVYDSLYVGNFTDIDVGFAWDDYIGCDTLSESYYVYNGVIPDITFPEPFPYETTLGYGNNPPAQAVTLLNQHMSTFMNLREKYWEGGYSSEFPYLNLNEPANEYYLTMMAYYFDSVHLFNYGLPLGHPSPNPVMINSNYCYPSPICGNYPDSVSYTEISANNPPFDRRGVGSSGPYSLAPGQYITFDYAYITGDTIWDSCANVNNLLNNIWQVRSYFNNNHPQDGHDLALGIETENQDNITPQFNVYPNPTNSHIVFTTNMGNTKFKLDILDINGRLIQSYNSSGTKKEMDVSGYINGVYILKISSAEQSSFVKFIKM
jgi:hypothetical protein